MNCTVELVTELKNNTNIEKAKHSKQFFKSFPGGYGEGDMFLGITVPIQRKIAKKYYKFCTLKDIEVLLNNEFHEIRLTALFILTYKLEKSDNNEEIKKIVDLYINKISKVNNWDLVDSSAPKILGPYFLNKDKSLLYNYANSNNLWKQRISIITTQYFIKNNQFQDTLNISKILLNHSHDLIHKAVGWMLREIGNRNFEVEFNFLKDHYKNMPRTMLRYAIEKFDKELRVKFLKGKI
ncbi:DNA alkylation repair protein [Tepiditoga spiralis]|uniref:DNA alkylation repair protein n=1 Tax=Tepiditoga spiralis TaxID=2108365 RepID=A0A7G1G883_9BACT|nr:DNA alkylation repair protein [Tepiditoga spiralis]BBE31434.1 DNA alkylation repair protein [Tepiditoga spiralis]